MKRTPQPRGPSDVDMFRHVASTLTNRVAEALSSHGLTVDQWRVLRSLTESGPQTMSDLGQSTTISGPTLSRVVDKLVTNALVYRNVDAGDRRKVLVHAAERGQTVVEQLLPDVEAAERQALAPLSTRETQTLRTLLERIASS